MKIIMKYLFLVMLLSICSLSFGKVRYVAVISSGNMVANLPGIVVTNNYNGNVSINGELEVDKFKTPYENTYTIAKSGGDYTTIQSALDANTGGNALFEVYPGTYTDDTINFSANNQCVRGMGCAPKNVLITKATTICDFGAHTGNLVQNLKMVMTLAPNDYSSTVTGSGSCNFRFAHTECNASGVNTAANTGSTCFRGTGTVKIVEGTVAYYNSTNRGGRGKNAILVEAGSDYTIDDVKFIGEGSGQSSSICLIRNNSTGKFSLDKSDMNITDNVSSITYGINIDTAEGDPETIFNTFHVVNSLNEATCIKAGSNGNQLTLRSIFNHLHAEAGGNAYSFKITDADVAIISQFDDIVAAEGVSNSVGTYTYVNSEADGDMEASGTISATVLLGKSQTAVTDEIRYPVKMLHETTGDMADTFGVGWSAYIEDVAGVENNIGNIWFERDGNDESGKFIIETFLFGTGIEAFAINSQGYVGIGDTTPQAHLEVVGDLMISAAATGDGDLFIVESGGDVGIGRANPRVKLDVAGTVSANRYKGNITTDNETFMINGQCLATTTTNMISGYLNGYIQHNSGVSYITSVRARLKVEDSSGTQNANIALRINDSPSVTLNLNGAATAWVVSSNLHIALKDGDDVELGTDAAGTFNDASGLTYQYVYMKGKN